MPAAACPIILQTTGLHTVALSDLPGAAGGLLLKSAAGAFVSVSDTGIVLNNGQGAVITLTGASVTVNGRCVKERWSSHEPRRGLMPRDEVLRQVPGHGHQQRRSPGPGPADAPRARRPRGRAQQLGAALPAGRGQADGRLRAARDRQHRVGRVRAGQPRLPDLDRRASGGRRRRCRRSPSPPRRGCRTSCCRPPRQNSLLITDTPGPQGGIVLSSPGGSTLIVNDTGIYLTNGDGVDHADRVDRGDQQDGADGGVSMPGYLLHIGATVQCTHLAPATATPGAARVFVSGKPVATVTSVWNVAGCTFQIPVRRARCHSRAFGCSGPCLGPDRRRRQRRAAQPGIGTGAGACLNAEQAPQGAPIVNQMQLRATGT